MDQAGESYIRGILESLLFISEKPVTLDQIKEVIDGAGANDIRRAAGELQEEYEAQKRGMVIVEIAGGYQMLSSPHYVSHIRKFFKTRVKEKLSRPALETLAIMAYKQPVTRLDVELIRGVNSDGVVLHLVNKGLIKIVGRKDVPGRPFLYGTTKLFLEYFGLKSLSDLPKLEQVAALKSVGEENAAPVSEEAPAAAGEGQPQGESEKEAVPEEAAQGQEDSGPRAQEATEAEPGSDENAESPADAAAPFAEQDAEELKQAMDDINREKGQADAVVDGQEAQQACPDNAA